jgi:hypothetical protein
MPITLGEDKGIRIVPPTTVDEYRKYLPSQAVFVTWACTAHIIMIRCFVEPRTYGTMRAARTKEGKGHLLGSQADVRYGCHLIADGIITPGE